MAVVGPPVHLPAGDDVDARDLLFEDGGLGGAQLRVGEIARRELSCGDQPVEDSYQRGTLWAPMTVVV